MVLRLLNKISLKKFAAIRKLLNRPQKFGAQFLNGIIIVYIMWFEFPTGPILEKKKFTLKV